MSTPSFIKVQSIVLGHHKIPINTAAAWPWTYFLLVVSETVNCIHKIHEIW